MQSSVRIGTRGSILALVQANLVRTLLAKAHARPLEDFEIVTITTSGDRITDRPLSEVGGKGLFTKEIEHQLLNGEIDLAVHSAKDVATVLPEGLEMAAYLEREDVRDGFISLSAASFAELPQGARLGTSSIRRAAQMLRQRPDLKVVPFRGNVDTRLKKLADGVADATLLAGAGLKRLDKANRVTQWLDPELFPPAPAQGAIGIEIRSGDAGMAALIRSLDHAPTHRAVRAERALLAVLDGSCRTPIAAYTNERDGMLHLLGEILSPDGRTHFRAEQDGALDAPQALGEAVAQALLDEAGPDFLARFGR